MQMIINRTDTSNTSIHEALSNSNGKTSISAILGSICILSGILYFGAGIIYAAFGISGFENILIQSLGLTTLGSTMIVVKKINSPKDKTNTKIDSENSEN